MKQEILTDQKAVLNDFLSIVWHGKLIIMLTFLTTVLTVYAGVQFLTEKYSSHANLLVTLGRENVQVPLTVDRGGVYTSGVRQEEINSEIRLLQSRALIGKAIDIIGIHKFKFEPAPPENLLQAIKYYIKKGVRYLKTRLNSLMIFLNLKKQLSDREKIILMLEKNFTVERLKDSDVINLAVRLPSPQLCKKFLSVLLDLYLDQRIKVRYQANLKDIFRAQAENYNKELKRLEEEKKQLRIASGINSVTVQRNLLLQRLHDLNSKIDNTKFELALVGENYITPTNSDHISRHEQCLPSMPGLSVTMIKEKLTHLKLRYAELASSFSSSSDRIKTLRMEMATITRILANGLQARLQALEKQVDQIEKKLHAFNMIEISLQDKEREIKIAENNYLTYAKRYEEAIITEKLDEKRVANVMIMTHPDLPIKPVSPRKVFILELSCVIGLVMGIALVMLLDYFDETVRNERDLKRIEGLTCIGTFNCHENG